MYVVITIFLVLPGGTQLGFPPYPMNMVNNYLGSACSIPYKYLAMFVCSYKYIHGVQFENQ